MMMMMMMRIIIIIIIIIIIVLIQRYNAVAFRGSFVEEDDDVRG